MKTWTRTEFAKITGTPDRKILFYTENGLFPDINRYVGRGAARQYTLTEILDLELIKEMGKFGIPLNKVRELICYVHSISDVWMPQGGIFTPIIVTWCPDGTDDSQFGYEVIANNVLSGSSAGGNQSQIRINLAKIFSEGFKKYLE